ncbi:hypothetical protein C8Q77DRAFT_550577 [Trametes polyzona]|nr:hypothetical protein C8Q77DRAFT_550577 [Trametes polyzona]
MDAKDVEAGIEGMPLLLVGEHTPGDREERSSKLSVVDSTQSGHTSSPLSATSRSSSLLGRIRAMGEQLYAQAAAKVDEAYPRIIDNLHRAARLCLLSLMIIFVVALASWFIALSHWFTIVFGHLFLRYTVPIALDDAFARCGLDNTMLFAGVGAFVVNLPPFFVFLVSFVFTFDRAVLEGSAAPANEFIKRITPTNRYALIFMKYAPRLLAGPIGCKIFWFIDGDNDRETAPVLDPLHAVMAGVAGEVVLTGLGMMKSRLLRKRMDVGASNAGSGGGGEVLPTTNKP